MGHFGVQLVIDRLRKNYYRREIGDTVVAVVQACLPCARVKASFRESSKELHPLPIRGLGYRWGVDFGGTLFETAIGNTYMLVCIEHFTRFLRITGVSFMGNFKPYSPNMQSLIGWHPRSIHS